MRFEILLAGIIASASAQVIKANQDPPVTPPPNLANTLVPTPPVDAQVTGLADPEAHEKLFGPIGDLASAIVHSVETSVLGKVTDVPASELNKLSSSIAAKESQIINGAESAAAEASATKGDAGAGNKEGEQKAPVETGRAGDANDGEDGDEGDKDHDHDDKDHDHDDKDHDKDHGDEGKEKQVYDGDDAAANTGEAVENDAASTAGDDANAGDIADEANSHVGADTGAEDKGEADLSSPEGLRNPLN